MHGARELSMMQIAVFVGGRSQTMTLPSNATVADLKDFVEIGFQVARAAQRIYFQGDYLARDTQRLAAYGVVDGATLSMAQAPIDIVVAVPDPEMSAVLLRSVPTTLRILDLKWKLEDATGIP